MKNALVTASTRGIGKQIKDDLLSLGYNVISFTREDADLSTLEGNNKILRFVENNGIVLDAIVLNMGITDRTPFRNLTLEQWNHVMNCNLNYPIFLLKSLVPMMNYNSSATFISSIAGQTPDSVSIPYGVSKGAIGIAVKYLANEFQPCHIRVNAVAPGYIYSDWHKDKPLDQLERISNKCLQRRLGEPKEVSSLVLEVIKNDFINGQTFNCDGGFGL